MQEDLNQLCVYNISQKKFWIYLDNFKKHCFDEKSKTKEKEWRHTPEECTNEALKAAGISNKELKKCIDNSFGGEFYNSTTENILL